MQWYHKDKKAKVFRWEWSEVQWPGVVHPEFMRSRVWESVTWTAACRLLLSQYIKSRVLQTLDNQTADCSHLDTFPLLSLQHDCITRTTLQNTITIAFGNSYYCLVILVYRVPGLCLFLLLSMLQPYFLWQTINSDVYVIVLHCLYSSVQISSWLYLWTPDFLFWSFIHLGLTLNT